MVHSPLFLATGPQSCCGIQVRPPRVKGRRAKPSESNGIPCWPSERRVAEVQGDFVAWGPNQRSIVTGVWQYESTAAPVPAPTYYVWSLPAGRQLRKLAWEHIGVFWLQERAEAIVVAGSEEQGPAPGPAIVWDIGSGKPVGKFPSGMGERC